MLTLTSGLDHTSVQFNNFALFQSKDKNMKLDNKVILYFLNMMYMNFNEKKNTEVCFPLLTFTGLLQYHNAGIIHMISAIITVTDTIIIL